MQTLKSAVAVKELARLSWIDQDFRANSHTEVAIVEDRR